MTGRGGGVTYDEAVVPAPVPVPTAVDVLELAPAWDVLANELEKTVHRKMEAGTLGVKYHTRLSWLLGWT